MAWKCPRCGVENEEPESRCIGGCGYVRIPVRLILTSEGTGKNLRMHITTSIGRALLRNLSDAEAAYASEPQFDLVKDEALGAWVIRHSSTAKNPTFYNGAAVGVETPPLQTGGVISIGPEHLKLTVTLEN